MPPTAVVGAAQHAELDRELDLVAAAGDRLADEQLVVSRAVEVAGIEKGHAAFDRGVNDGDALRVVRLAVGAGHSHAAECDSRGHRVGGEWSVVHGPILRSRAACACRFLARFLRQECTSADRARAVLARAMERSVELPVSLPGLRAVRATTTSLHTGVKEHYGVGRIEHGDTEWWGGGRVWRSAPGCILVKQPGDVVRHLAHNGPTTFTAVTLPTSDVARVQGRRQSGGDRAARDQRRTRRAVSPPDRCRVRGCRSPLARGRGRGSDQCARADQQRASRPFASRPTRDGVHPRAPRRLDHARRSRGPRRPRQVPPVPRVSRARSECRRTRT